MSRPGLLVVNSSRSWGGNEHWAVRIARGLAERGHPVRFVWSHETVGERVRAAGLDGRRLALRADADLPAVLTLAREMRRVGSQAVLLTRWREYLLGGLAARLAGRPRVVMGLGLKIVPRQDLKRRLVFRLADRVLVNAPEIAAALCTRPWIPPEKIAVVVNGVDLDRWRPRWEPDRRAAGEHFRAEHGIPAQAPLLVNVGNLVEQKDQAGLVAACALLRPRFPDLRAVIMGEGALRPRLEAAISEHGLEGTVILAGFVADPAPALAAADLFVLSSQNEGMAWVLMEAAASGLPIVTTDVSGARHCVEDGVTGLVVPVADPEALAGAAARLLADADRREVWGQAARRLAERRLGAGRMLEATAAVLFGQ